MSEPVIVDTWWEPSDAQISAAKAAGVVGWCGYLGQPGDREYHPWSDDTFRRVLAAGLWTVGFCSGWDSPSWVRARAAALGITAILDVEPSIRGDGAWVDPWLDASGAALYGGQDDIRAHINHGHPGYVVAGYPGGDPGAFWPDYMPQPNPARPLAWQYAGSVTDPWSNGQSFDKSHYGPGWSLIANSPVSGVTFTVADLDPAFIIRGIAAWFLDEHDVQPTGPAIDWFLAHAHDVGAGQLEWEIEGALAGTDSAQAPQIAASAKRLRQLGQGQWPADMQPPQGPKGDKGDPGSGASGGVPSHTHAASTSVGPVQ